MKLEHLKAFMACLGVYNIHHTGGEWAQCSCPLAPMTHGKGSDANPSFGVSVGEGQSAFNCFVCRKGHTLAELLGIVEMLLPKWPLLKPRYNIAKAREILDAEESNIALLPEYAELVPSPYTEWREWPHWWLDSFQPVNMSKRATKYLDYRQITTGTRGDFKLRYDPARDMIVCPFFDHEGRLAGARGRLITLPGELDHKKLKHYDYAFNGVRNSHLTWYNEQVLDAKGPMLIVEGQFDVMRVWPHYAKVMAILSAKAPIYKMRKLTGEDQVVLMLDGDDTGQTKQVEWATYLHKRGVQVGYLPLPPGVPSILDPTKEAKDAGDLPDDVLAELLFDL